MLFLKQNFVKLFRRTCNLAARNGFLLQQEKFVKKIHTCRESAIFSVHLTLKYKKLCKKFSNSNRLSMNFCMNKVGAFGFHGKKF